MPPRRLGAGAVLTALLLALPFTYFQGYDYLELHTFYKQYLREGILSGQAPWWNPYVALGRPYFADIETTVCYPPNWLIFPLGVTAGVTAMVALHLALGLYGAVRLGGELGLGALWSWVGALTYPLAGFVLARLQLGQMHVFFSLCWVPLVFYAAARLQARPDRAGVARMAAVLALWILAGSPPFVWVDGLGLAAWVALRSPSLRAAGRGLLALVVAGTVALELAAVQLIPWIELLGQGNRPAHAVEYATRHGMRAPEWLGLALWPSAGRMIPPESNVGLGLPLALAAGVGCACAWRRREDRALALVALLGGVLAAGALTPLLPFLAAHVPGFGALRFPTRYSVLAATALLWLGLRALQRFVPARWAPPVAALQLAAVALAGFACVRSYALHFGGFWDEQVKADLVAHGAFGPAGVPPRIAFDEERVRPNSGMVEGYSSLGGFANPHLGRVWTAVHEQAGLVPPAFAVHEIALEVFDHGPFPVPDANLVLGWDQAAGHPVWRPPAAADPRAAVRGGGTAEIIRYTRNALDVRTRAAQAGLLVLAEPWYPGWSATVNGAPAEVVLADGWKRAVAVPAGPAEVRLTFFPRNFYLGLAISGAALAAVIAGWRRKTVDTGAPA
jgi:hypothetical protein